MLQNKIGFMKKILLFFCLVSLFFGKTFAQNSLGSPVIINEVRAFSGSQFIELYNEGNISGQSLSCYTLVIWKENALSPAGDFYVVNFNDGTSFNGSDRFLVLNSTFLQSNAAVSLYTFNTSTNDFIITSLTSLPTDLLQSGSVENAIFLFRNSGSMADAVITKTSLDNALAIINGFSKIWKISPRAGQITSI